MQTSNIPVLIVGGGPAGLTAAVLLARANVPVMLVERHLGTSIHPRARGLNIRTMEIFRGLGLEGAIREAGQALAQSRYMLFVETLAGREIRRVPDDDLVLVGDQLAQITPCNWIQCAQDELEPILADAARSAGADLRFNTELVSFTQNANGVTATLLDRTSGVERGVDAQYLIAADGAKSPIREMLGVAFSGRGGIEHYVNAYFQADLRAYVQDRWFGICFVENEESPGLFLAVNNTDRWLFNIEYSPTRGQSAADYTPERCIDLIRKAVGVPDLPVELISALPWEADARVADQLCVGRVFLVGDAAHVMPPAGGFGLNTGVHDAHNLAWKLAAVLNHTADAALLNSYEVERQPVARLVVGQAVGELEAPSPDMPPERSHGGPPDDEQGGPPGGDDPAEAMQAQIAIVLGYQYASCAVIADGSQPPDTGLDLNGRPGTRAPHVWLDRGHQRSSTLDLFGSGFVLLTANNAWLDASRTLNTAIQAIEVNREVLTAYGVRPDGAVLIRPDGFVGWRNAPDEIPADLARILTTLHCDKR